MKKLSITLLLAILIFNSCTKVLDQVPQDKITEENFYKSPGDAEAAATGIYDAAQAISTQYPVAFDAASDLENALLINYSPFSQHGITVDNAIVLSYWQNNYVGIGRCNDVLLNVPKINAGLFAPGQKDRILAEARFMRGWFYYNLVRAFGGVPLVTVPYSSFNADFTIARSSSDQVYAQIVADLKIAEANLPLSYSSNIDTRGRGTQGGAKALLSKVYLSMKDYTNAAAESLDVMNNTTYSLVTGATAYTNMFSASSKNSTESIFEIQYVSSSSESNGLFSLYVPTPAPSGIQGGSYQIAPTAKIMNAFETGDIRKTVSVTNSPATPPVPYVGKYLRLTNGTDPNIINLRLADIILVRAEALNALGQTADATAALNIIRRRAFGLSLTATSVRDFPSANDIANSYDLTLAIENERMKELCFEGQRFYDLVRTGRAAAVLGISVNQTLWPIPLRETGRNPKLTQNPGY
jgi:hypothetical protein